nr:hypothetical protein [Bacteroidales bacterium]
NINAFRAYFQLEGELHCAALQGGPIHSITLDFGDGTTGIGEITHDGDLKIRDTSTWYDISGRRMQGTPVQKGMYIHNGRKVIIP